MIAAKQVQTPQTPTEKADTRKAAFVKILKSANETLKDLEHPNIVQYLGSEETPNFFSMYVVHALSLDWVANDNHQFSGICSRWFYL